MKSIDEFLNRVPAKKYNCMDFVREVWLDLTGEDVVEHLAKLTGDFANRKATVSGMKFFKRLASPIEPCFIVLQRKRTVPHVGIFIDGRMLHLTALGVELTPINFAKRYYKDVRYYR